jgi:hypothetical protein
VGAHPVSEPLASNTSIAIGTLSGGGQIAGAQHQASQFSRRFSSLNRCKMVEARRSDPRGGVN